MGLCVRSWQEMVSFAEFCNDQRVIGDLELSQKLKALFVMEMMAHIRSSASQSAQHGPAWL